MSDKASLHCVSVFILTALSLGGSQVNNSAPVVVQNSIGLLQGFDFLNISTGIQSNNTKRLDLYDHAEFFDWFLNMTKYNHRVRPDTTVEVEYRQKESKKLEL